MTDFLVTGATGAVGPALVQRLLERGHSVRVFSRRPEREPWGGGVRPYRGSIVDPAALAPAVSGVQVICHLSALLHLDDPPASMLTEYERVNVEGTRRVVEAALASRVQRLVFFSTIAVYGSTGGRPADEESELRPDSPYAKTKAMAEAIVLGARRETGEPLSTVLRPAAVYGPRMKGNYERLLNALEKGRFIPLGRGENRRTLVFDQDLADAAIAVAAAAPAAGRIYNVTDGTFHEVREIIEAISNALGRKAPSLYLPSGPVRAVVRVVEEAATLMGLAPPLRTATIDKYLEDVAVRGIRISDEVPWKPRVDIRAGWRATIEQRKLARDRSEQTAPDRSR